MDRTFPQRVTLAGLSGILLLTAGAFCMFWFGHPLLGLLVVLLVVVAMERHLHSSCIFRGDSLVISRGRFLRSTTLPISSIKGCFRMKGAFGLGHFLMIEYGNNRMMAVEPRDEKGFLRVLRECMDRN